MAPKTLEKEDRISWLNFLNAKTSTVTYEDIEFIVLLHAKYYNHKPIVPKPCGCKNDPARKQINNYIDELNDLL